MGLGIHAGYGLNIREDRIDLMYEEKDSLVLKEHINQVSEDTWEEWFYGCYSERARAVSIFNSRPHSERVWYALDARDFMLAQNRPLRKHEVLIFALSNSLRNHKRGR